MGAASALIADRLRAAVRDACGCVRCVRRVRRLVCLVSVGRVGLVGACAGLWMGPGGAVGSQGKYFLKPADAAP
jgi:hypothetical protein